MKKLKLIEELTSYNNQQTFGAEDQNTSGIEEQLEFKVEKLHHQSSFASNSLLDPVYMVNHDSVEVVLVNVELSVHTSPQAEHVQYVSLTSEACGIAVLGYPLDVGEIADALPPSERSGDRGTSLNQLGWRIFKRTRTPVCYVTSSLSASIFENARPKNVGENGLLREGKSPAKQFNRGETALNKTCVPVELVFSKILAAVD